MVKNKEVYLMCALLGLGALMGGCAGNTKVASTEVPNQPMSNEETQNEKAAYKATDHYVVKPNDCLWTIAGKPNIYGDPFQWPALYKANRDFIRDPDLIYVNQKLKVVEGLTQAQIDQARKLASKTPGYKPHHKPREKQMVSYF
jgi:hypothetical protein